MAVVRLGAHLVMTQALTGSPDLPGMSGRYAVTQAMPAPLSRSQCRAAVAGETPSTRPMTFQGARGLIWSAWSSWRSISLRTTDSIAFQVTGDGSLLLPGPFRP